MQSGVKGGTRCDVRELARCQLLAQLRFPQQAPFAKRHLGQLAGPDNLLLLLDSPRSHTASLRRTH